MRRFVQENLLHKTKSKLFSFLKTERTYILWKLDDLVNFFFFFFFDIKLVKILLKGYKSVKKDHLNAYLGKACEFFFNYFDNSSAHGY